MKLTIRWKLMGSYLLLLLVMGVVLSAYLSHTLEEYLVSGIRDHLFSEARLAELMASREIRELRRDSPAVAVDIGKQIKARVTIIGSTGDVLGDSEVSPQELPTLENHLLRPEVQDALKSGTGSAIRHSATLQTDMLYVALPLSRTGEPTGVIRLALPLSAVEKTKASLHANLGGALALALILAAILSYILSNVTSRTLRTMATAAASIGRGDFSRRLPVVGRDELGELGRVMNEMTERLDEQLKRLSAEKSRLDAILRGMGEGLMVTDARGTVVLVNPAFLKFFAIEDVVGRPLIDISRHPALNRACRLVADTCQEYLEEITLPHEGEKTLLTHWVPLLENGEVKGVVAVFHDISDLKRLERIRKDFVANVSHELRTPVTVIKGYAETLMGGVLRSDPERSASFIGVIQSHAERLATLINDLLALSELESGGISLELKPVSLEGTVGHVCRLLEQKAHDKGITIDRSGIEGAPQVLADRGKLEQVLINLLDNAIKYTPENGSVSFSAVEAGEMVRISVADTGIGIPPKDIPRIFERFYRVDTARSREMGGTGLGLSIVRHIVQLHGGTVSVESTHGKGTIFSFTLKRGA
ncbi:MAG: HAMP domain-containing protein [Geobacter sp.]|nr:HAMP domain-containing protein [Geobacter sp.]